jgi:pilus assembly protein Flp/PilA
MYRTINDTATTDNAKRTSRTADRARERGASLVEYALVVGLIAVVALVAVGLVGGSVSDSFDGTATAFAAAGNDATVDYPTETAGVDGKVKATFIVVDGEVILDSTDADGWTMTILQDTGTRVNTRFKNDTTGEVIRVNGWTNKKGVLLTKVIEK